MPFRIGYASGVGRLVFIPSSLSPQRAWAVRTAAAARGTHCNSEALTVNEWRVARGGTGHFWSGQSHWRHSESICGHPWPSVAQGMSSDANRCTQMQLHSGASSCTQLRTAANSCEQLRTAAISLTRLGSRNVAIRHKLFHESSHHLGTFGARGGHWRELEGNAFGAAAAHTRVAARRRPVDVAARVP